MSNQTFRENQDQLRAQTVKQYKSILLNIVCCIEFLNDKYDPFGFKLKDWSRNVAASLDDYTKILEEIYEKYKDSNVKISPEITMFLMILISGISLHISNELFKRPIYH